MRKLLWGKDLGRAGLGPRDVTRYRTRTYNYFLFLAGNPILDLTWAGVLAHPFGFRRIFVSQRVLILSRKEWRTDLDDADKYYIMVIDS